MVESTVGVTRSDHLVPSRKSYGHEGSFSLNNIDPEIDPLHKHFSELQWIWFIVIHQFKNPFLDWLDTDLTVSDDLCSRNRF